MRRYARSRSRGMVGDLISDRMGREGKGRDGMGRDRMGREGMG